MITERKRFKAVSAPEIQDAGIADLMKKPADGTDRKKHINWIGAKFMIAASTEDGQPSHQIIIEYPNLRLTSTAKGNFSQSMAVGVDEAGNPETIETVSGPHSEGMGRLNDAQKELMIKLVQRSIDAGQY